MKILQTLHNCTIKGWNGKTRINVTGNFLLQIFVCHESIWIWSCDIYLYRWILYRLLRFLVLLLFVCEESAFQNSGLHCNSFQRIYLLHNVSSSPFIAYLSDSGRLHWRKTASNCNTIILATLIHKTVPALNHHRHWMIQAVVDRFEEW